MFSYSELLRIVLLVVVGVPVTSALLSGTIALMLQAQRLGVPTSDSDKVSALVFGALSLAVVAIVMRASIRTLRGGQSFHPAIAWLARLGAGLVVVGLGAGVYLGGSIVSSHDADLRERAAADCALLGASVSEAALADRCVAQARSCHRLAIESPDRLPSPTIDELNALPDLLRDRSGARRLEAVCLLQALSAGVE